MLVLFLFQPPPPSRLLRKSLRLSRYCRVFAFRLEKDVLPRNRATAALACANQNIRLPGERRLSSTIVSLPEDHPRLLPCQSRFPSPLRLAVHHHHRRRCLMEEQGRPVEPPDTTRRLSTRVNRLEWNRQAARRLLDTLVFRFRLRLRYLTRRDHTRLCLSPHRFLIRRDPTLQYLTLRHTILRYLTRWYLILRHPTVCRYLIVLRYLIQRPSLYRRLDLPWNQAPPLPAQGVLHLSPVRRLPTHHRRLCLPRLRNLHHLVR